MGRIRGEARQEKAPTRLLPLGAWPTYKPKEADVPDDTRPSLSDLPSRAEWRDAIRIPDGPLGMNARHVALTMADYWLKPPETTIWCPVETICGHTGGSVRTVNRALVELRDLGFLRLVVPASQGRAARYAPVVPSQVRADKCQLGVSTGAKLAVVQVPTWRPTPYVTPYGNPDSASEQAPTPSSAPAETSASPTSSPTPQASIPKPRGWTDWRSEDRILWENTLEASDDYAPDQLDEIYIHWCERYDWPGRFVEYMAQDHRLDGFLGGAGVDLGLYDEEVPDTHEPASADPWATSKSA